MNTSVRLVPNTRVATSDDSAVVEIPLTRGFKARISSEDFERVSRHKWCVCIPSSGKPYACATIHQKFVYLHRFILDAPKDVAIDHADSDGLNCTRANLRTATATQNSANRRHIRAASGYKGVRARRERFLAQIKHRGRQIFLGSFSSAEEAAAAYDTAAVAIFGSYACTNSSILAQVVASPGA